MFATVPQAIPLELLATTPPSVQAISLAGSGPELAAEPGQPGVDLTHRRARADPHPGAAVEDLDVPEVPPGVHQDAVGHRLAAQAGAAGPERHRHTLGRRDGEQPADLGRVDRGGDRARGQREVRGVMAQRQPVGRPAADLPRTAQRRPSAASNAGGDSGSVAADLRCSFHSCSFAVDACGLSRTTACLRIGTEFTAPTTIQPRTGVDCR